MAKKSCSNCKNSVVIAANSFIYGQQGTKNALECTCREELKELGAKNNWDIHAMPKECGKYEPKIVHTCSYCGKEINKPEHEWELWTSPYSTPVCSLECQAKKEAALIGNLFAD